MVKDDAKQVLPFPQVPRRAPARPVTHGLAYHIAAASLFGISLLAATGFLMAHWLSGPPVSPAAEKSAAPSPAMQLFRDWPTDKPPLLALLLSGQEHGYLQPCGCSKPQLGGLPRRYNFMEQLKARGWPVVAVDLGDVPDPRGHRGPQALLKYKTSMETLQRLGYTAVGLGQHELEMPLFDVLAEFALQPNNTSPRILAANITNKAAFENTVAAWEIGGGKDGAPRVGVVGTLGPSVIERMPKGQNPAPQFGDNRKVLTEALQQLQAKKPEVLVLLYQGTLKEAKACATKFPQFHVILCLTEEEEPSDKPERVGDTMIVGVGHKGRYVGVVGFYPGTGPKQTYSLRYQLVPLGEEYETPLGQEAGNPVMVMMEEYAKQVKAGNYMAQHPRSLHPVQVAFPKATYVGSVECKQCHAQAYKKWAESKHSEAYLTLQNATRPKLREFDGECVACHVVGFEHPTGFKDENSTPLLMGVGCESCHGPGSEHINNVHNKQIHLAMNPFKPKPGATKEEEAARLNRLDQSCQKCHDSDNDVHWKLAKRWPEIEHHEDRSKKKQPAGK